MKLLTVAETAKVLRTNPASVYKLIHAGVLPNIKLGQYKIREEALEQFLANSEGQDFSSILNSGIPA